MRTQSVAILAIAVILVGITDVTAKADLPSPMTPTFFIREVPTDPESDIVFTITVKIQAVDIDQDWVAWDVTDIAVREIGSNGATINEWTDAAPTVETTSGLWWVEHVDPQAPQIWEFNTPPLIYGTASAQGGTPTDLDYVLEGNTCDAACQQMYNGSVGALDFELDLVGEPDPYHQGVAETTQIDDDDYPPAG